MRLKLSSQWLHNFSNSPSRWAHHAALWLWRWRKLCCDWREALLWGRQRVSAKIPMVPQQNPPTWARKFLLHCQPASGTVHTATNYRAESHRDVPLWGVGQLRQHHHLTQQKEVSGWRWYSWSTPAGVNKKTHLCHSCSHLAAIFLLFQCWMASPSWWWQLCLDVSRVSCLSWSLFVVGLEWWPVSSKHLHQFRVRCSLHRYDFDWLSACAFLSGRQQSGVRSVWVSFSLHFW